MVLYKVKPPKDTSKPHNWFAWYPVNCQGRWIWFEVVTRSIHETPLGWDVDYVRKYWRR